MEQNRFNFIWIFKVLMLGISCFLLMEIANLLIELPPKLVISAEAWIAWFTFMEMGALIVIYHRNSQIVSAISIAIGISLLTIGTFNLTNVMALGDFFGIQSILAGFWTVSIAGMGERISFLLRQDEKEMLA